MTGDSEETIDGEIIIKSSVLADVEAINHLEKLVFSPKLRYGSSIIAGIITTASPQLALTATLLEVERVIGFIAGEIDNNKSTLGRIITIEIDPKYQQRHIGSELLQKIEFNMREIYHVLEVELQVHSKNKTAIEFYQKHSYQKIRELKNYYSRKEHAILMRKELT